MSEPERLPTLDVIEDNGYDAPFVTFTWVRWIEMQAQMMQCSLRFQRAIEQRRFKIAMQVYEEMHYILAQWHHEAASWLQDDL